MAHRFLLAAGGSGGHIFPAIKAAKELQRRGHYVKIIGALQKFKDQVEQAGVDYTLLDVRGLSLSKIHTWPKAFFQFYKAWHQVNVELKLTSFDAVVGFGGYSSFPVVISAKQNNIATMLHEQNVVPGRANKFLSRYVDVIAIAFPQTNEFISHRHVVHTGSPVLQPLKQISRQKACEQWGLDINKTTLLVVGGSQGSERINEAVLEVMQDWRTDSLQIIHMAGPRQASWLESGYGHCDLTAKVVPFIEDMASAYQAADLVIARSGAGLVSEIAYFRKKAILIPYPHAQQHQLANAKVLASLGMAEIIKQENLNKKTLEGMILKLKGDTIIPAGVESVINRIFLPQPEIVLAETIESLIL